MTTPTNEDLNASTDLEVDFDKEAEEVEAMSNDQLVEAMLQAKNDRRRAESDVQLLANRLAHLKAEEEKARRKIAETQRRAKRLGILSLRMPGYKEKNWRKRGKDKKMIQREQQRVAMRRANQRAKRKGASTQLNKDKLLYVRQQRAQAKAHREKVLKSKAAEEKRAKELKDKIRQREIRLKMKRRRKKKRRIEQAKAYRNVYYWSARNKKLLINKYLQWKKKKWNLLKDYVEHRICSVRLILR